MNSYKRVGSVHNVLSMFVVVGMLLGVLQSPQPVVAQTASAHTSRQMGLTSLAQVLNTDGTLNLSAGFNGSLDVKGWQLMTAPDGSPRFERADTTSPQSPQSPGAYYTPGDENWHSGFGPRGTDPGHTVNAIAISNNKVFVGAHYFYSAGGILANSIAMWNASTNSWSALGQGIYDSNGGNPGTVNALAISGDQLYVGGSFDTAGGAGALRIAVWNMTTNTWSALGDGIGRSNTATSVLAIAVSGSDVYAGGTFDQAGGVPASRIARWSTASNTWSALGSGVTSQEGSNLGVNAIAVSGSDVFVTGQFNKAGDITVNSIARWNSGSNRWFALSTGLQYAIDQVSPGAGTALAISGTDVYVGGSFYFAGGITTTNVAHWNGANWSALGADSEHQGVPGQFANVRSLAVNGSDVYVFGSFSSVGGAIGAGGVAVQNIARWNADSNSWSAFGSMPTNSLITAAIGGGSLYVGGGFDTAGGAPAYNVAQCALANCTFSALDDGLSNGIDSTVYAIAITGTNVYIGGVFKAVGGMVAWGVARWNTSTKSWSSLGGVGLNNVGTPGQVYALAVNGDDVYVGGRFEVVGAAVLVANNIARWNSTSQTWSALSSSGNVGVDGPVYAIAVDGSDVYVGGSFRQQGLTYQDGNIERFNPSDGWQRLGAGVGGYGNPGAVVYAINVNGDDVFVGGIFTRAGGLSAKNFARWSKSGGRWIPVNGGDRVAVSDATHGSGPNFVAPVAITYGLDLSIFGEYQVLDSGLKAIIGMNKYSEYGQFNRFIVSGPGVGSGPAFDTPAGMIGQGISSTWNLLVVDRGSKAVVRVVLDQSGNRSILSGAGAGSGPDFVDPVSIGTNNGYSGYSCGFPASTTHCFAVGDTGLKAILHVDPESGDRIIFSGGITGTVGTGPMLDSPVGILQTNTSSGVPIYLVVDSGLMALVGVNIETGNRFIISGPGVGSGPAFVNPRSVENLQNYFNESSYVVTDSGLGAVVRVDMATGNRSILSNASTGSGPSLAAPTFIIGQQGYGDKRFYGSLLVGDSGSGAVRAVFPSRGTDGSHAPYDASVRGLISSGNTVYLVGAFDVAGGVNVGSIARFQRDTQTWSAFGSAGPFVYSIAMSGSDMTIAGRFYGGVARWDGTAWLTLGSGLKTPGGYDPLTYAVAVNGSDVFVGGSFVQAGNVAASNIAWWSKQTQATVTPSSGGSLTSPDGSLSIQFPPGAVNTPLTLTYTPQTQPQTVTGTNWLRGFILKATDGSGNPVNQFQQNYTLRLTYTDEQLAQRGISESTLNVVYWNGSQWVKMLPCTDCGIDTVNNVITVVANHFTEFALTGGVVVVPPPTIYVYLPLIVR